MDNAYGKEKYILHPALITDRRKWGNYNYVKQKTLLTINEKIVMLMTFKLDSSVCKKIIVNHRLGESIYNV